MSLRVKFVNSKLKFKTCFKCKESFPRDEDHFYKAFKQTDISALAAGNYFHFKENAYPNLKKYLKTKKIALR